MILRVNPIFLAISILLILLLLLVNFSQGAGGFEPQLFWSYFNKESMERASLGHGGYDRHSPSIWVGRSDYLGQADENLEDNSVHLTEDNLPHQTDNNILRLGEFLSVSHGPRRKREVEENGQDISWSALTKARQNKQGYIIQSVRNSKEHRGLGPGKIEKYEEAEISPDSMFWPVKFGAENLQNYAWITQNNPVSLPTVGKRYPDLAPYTLCAHHCTPGDSACCQQRSKFLPGFLPGFLPVEPVVEPSLLENWSTGIISHTPAIAAIFEFVVVLGFVGLLVGLISLLLAEDEPVETGTPGGRQIRTNSEAHSSFVLEVVDGNWLKVLEQHVLSQDTKNYQFQSKSFLCCVRRKSKGILKKKLPTATETERKEMAKTEKDSHRDGRAINNRKVSDNEISETDKSKPTDIDNKKKNGKDEGDANLSEDAVELEVMTGDDAGEEGEGEEVECIPRPSGFPRRKGNNLSCNLDNVYNISLSLKRRPIPMEGEARD